MDLRRGNLFLVGLMGSGKTTLGRHLARRLHKPFVDADVELESRLGVTIPIIFEIEGEAVFRDREQAVLADVAGRENIVLATGGGVVLREANRRTLKDLGTVIYLHATPETVFERVRRSRNRPLLMTADPLHRMRELYGQRDSLYRETADVVIESDREAASHLAQRIEALLAGPKAVAGPEAA